MQLLLYNIALGFYSLFLRIASAVHPKAKAFVQGRSKLFEEIKRQLAENRKEVIWVHCASLGEFEQGRPVIEAIKQRHPNYSIVLTFFSPSGYEVRKSYPYADFVFYLPMDRAKNAALFLDLVRPQLALFVKYELWFHYLEGLQQRKIPTVLFSAHFQENQVFFKWYGGLYRRMLRSFDRIFVQDQKSQILLKGIKISKVAIAGDTRFDRAVKTKQTDRRYENVERFKGGGKLIIAGSTWPADEALLKNALLHLPSEWKLLVAAHETDDRNSSRLLGYFDRSELWRAEPQSLSAAKVAIVDTVGDLAFLYRYADLVWVGGGFSKSGIHNIVEPAVYGVPVFFGPNYQRFREATDMLERNAAHSVSDAKAFANLALDENLLQKTREQASTYIAGQLGATDKIMGYLEAKCFSST